MCLVICGLPGVGKSTAGKCVAKQLNRVFIDLDDLVEDLYFEQEGKRASCREIHASCGESGFRMWEHTALQTLDKKKNLVVSLGGGTLEFFANQKIIQNLGYVIYLNGSVQEIWQRLDTEATYLDKEHPQKSFFCLAEKRHLNYLKYANVVLDIAGLKKEEVVNCIIDKVREIYVE